MPMSYDCGEVFIVGDDGIMQPLTSIQDISEFIPSDENKTDNKNRIDLNNNWDLSFYFSPSAPGKWKRFVAGVAGWKAKGPYRRRLLNRLIFGR